MKAIGIDAGGTLTKVVYEEQGRYHYKTYDSKELLSVIKWLELTSPHAKIYVTGGKAGKIKSMIPHCAVYPEFKAVEEGTRLLLKEQKQKNVDRFILVNIGTGTSFFKVDDRNFTRVLGSGIGGGMFMGLGTKLTGVKDFSELVRLSADGRRESVDLMVNEIYEGQESPVPDYLTAANFAKYADCKTRKEDVLRSLTNMMAETIILLAHQLSITHNTGSIVFIGSTLRANTSLKEDLSQFKEMLDYDPIFIGNGAFSGSLGALSLGLKEQGDFTK
ncbi:type II pantothenate kinase [Bacillus sp. Marseille-Q1617]|uniref:type II pantothenate kinase n=1 Tax=Bacillus sp. Marseille-Q1617 TaxID=2736887 RepID=UPI00158D3501|nr:type II pantothenate kinase [Bacillus sp. Marseille-Q1617]